MKQRIEEIAHLRVVAMLMVVFYHCLCIYTPFWAAFDYGVRQSDIYYIFANLLNSADLPLFVLISGYLYAKGVTAGRDKGYMPFIAGKAQRLLLPYLVCGIIVLWLLPELYHPTQLLFGISHLWFLLMLFVLMTLAELTRRWWSKWSIVQGAILIGTAVVAEFLFKGTLATEPFKILYLTVYYLPCFAAGIMLCKYDWHRILSSHRLLLLLSVATCGWVATSLFIGKFYCFMLSRWFGWCVSALLLMSLLARRAEGKVVQSNAFVRLLDRHSLDIYCIHHILLEVGLKHEGIRQFFDQQMIIAPWICFAVLMAASLCICSVPHIVTNKKT